MSPVPQGDLLSATYSIPEAAARLGIGASTAYHLIAIGSFPVPVISLGPKNRRIRVAELEAYLKGSAPFFAPGCPEAVG